MESQDYGLPRSYAAYHECFVAIFRVEYGDIMFIPERWFRSTTQHAFTSHIAAQVIGLVKLPKLGSQVRRLQIVILNVGTSVSIPKGQAITLSYKGAILL